MSFDAEALRNEKVKVLDAVHPLDPAHLLRGQYAAGTIDGVPVPGYREEPGVAKELDDGDVRRAPPRDRLLALGGGAVPAAHRQAAPLPRDPGDDRLQGRSLPPLRGRRSHPVHSNHLVIRIQPDEGIAFSFIAKQPGPEVRTQKVRMDFAYGSSFKVSPPEAYERLLHDALIRDHTLFIREDEVERGWAIVDPVLRDPGPVTPTRRGAGDRRRRTGSAAASATGTRSSTTTPPRAHGAPTSEESAGR